MAKVLPFSHIFTENSSPFEMDQRRRTLGFMLWVTFCAGLALATINLLNQAYSGAGSLLTLSLICLGGVWLSRKGSFQMVAAIYSASILLILHFNLIDGFGLHDPGIVAYPILLVLAALFFGKMASLIFLVGELASMGLILQRESQGLIRQPVELAGLEYLATITVLLLVAVLLVSVIIDNQRRAMRRVQESEEAIRSAYDLTLEGWARALEYRDKETEGHSRRVSELSTRLARALNCSEEEIINIRRGALLHDIGKLAVPDSVLFKKGPLDPAERAAVELHPIYAQEMLGQIPFLNGALSIPYCHHERWDGLGYPQGLKGTEIPLPARIFAVVDQWEALSSDRPYRQAWPREKIILHVQENAGKMFDPHIAEVFLEIV